MPDAVLNSQEKEKLRVIRNTIASKLTNNQASKILKLSVRQIQRLKEKVRREGEKALIHGLKNQIGNHQVSLEQRGRVLNLIKENYAEFKPPFAAEKLAENHNISVNPETLRLWLIEEKLWKVKKQKSVKYHAWRERKEYLESCNSLMAHIICGLKKGFLMNRETHRKFVYWLQLMTRLLKLPMPCLISVKGWFRCLTSGKNI